MKIIEIDSLELQKHLQRLLDPRAGGCRLQPWRVTFLVSAENEETSYQWQIALCMYEGYPTHHSIIEPFYIDYENKTSYQSVQYWLRGNVSYMLRSCKDYPFLADDPRLVELWKKFSSIRMDSVFLSVDEISCFDTQPLDENFSTRCYTGQPESKDEHVLCAKCGVGTINLRSDAWLDPYLYYQDHPGAYVHYGCLGQKRRAELAEEHSRKESSK